MRIQTICLLLFAMLLGTAYSQKPNPGGNIQHWKFVPESQMRGAKAERQIIPTVYEIAQLDLVQLKNLLADAPLWFTPAAENGQITVSLPMPGGRFESFKVVEAPVMHPDLAAQFPMIKTYAGTGIEDPSAYLRFSVTQRGFHAIVLSPNHNPVLIDPYAVGNTEEYLVYYKKDIKKSGEWHCDFDLENGENRPEGGQLSGGQEQNRFAGDCQLRTYRLALACTGEYATFHGGTVALALAAITNSVVNVNAVYENDASIHMNLVANNNLIVYTNAATDPYTNNNGSTMLTENQNNVTAVIGTANYDIGHVFSTGGGGIAGLGVVCSAGNKARGVTGSAAPVGPAFDIDYVAHEMGHQFNANHTQNNNCNRNGATAMEPGSASTIMGYAGICAPDVQNNSDAYFHAISLQEIGLFRTTGGGNSCAVITDINDGPTAAAGLDYTIPKSTPFVLTATGSDPNGDAITYNWEQMDNATATMPPVSTNTGGPTFRSITALTSPKRYFPNLPAVVSGTAQTWEVLPSVARTMNFRVTVRDNHAGGGCTAEDNTIITVNGTAGPFLVTAPNVAGINWPALSTQTVTWDVAGTTANGVNCANVDILLSTDGGATFPITILAATPNDGTQSITVPNNMTTNARIMIRGTNHIFYDVSNVNFTISAVANDYTLAVSPTSQSVCAPANAQYTITVGTTGSFSGNVNLAVTGVPAGATSTFSVNPVAAPGTSVLTIGNTAAVASGTYTLTITATGATGTQTQNVTLVVANGSPAAVTLSAPANNATGQSLTPAFTWLASPTSANYDLQVSTSNTFATTAINQTGINGTTYTPTTNLAVNTVYYWRVRGNNGCGAGTWSAVWQFTTNNIVCNTFASTDVPKAISATGTPTVTSIYNMTAYGTVTDVNLVNLNITHTWINDLVVKIKSPLTTERTMFTQICNDQDNIITNFDDEAANTYASLPCPPTGNLFYQPNQTLNAFDGQQMNGIWTLTINDVANQDGGTLNSWSLNVCYIPPPPVVVTASSTNITCNGTTNGTATATATGGNGSFTYLWSNGATTAAITNLAAGTYTVTATSLGLTGTASVTITQPPVLAANVSGQNPDGTGDNGSAAAAPTGGVSPYTYLWSTAATSQAITNLPAGTFTVTVTDANACTKTGSVTLTYPAVVVTATNSNVSCFGGNDGSATATATGGNGSYTYLWSNGATTASITGLAAGTYTVTATSGGLNDSETVTVSQPTDIAIAMSSTDDDGSSNGTATASPSGGTPAYDYLWSNGGFTQTITGLPTGSYTCTVTDNNGCTKTNTVTVGNSTPVLSVIVTANDVSCNGAANGSAIAAPSGGTGTYSYAWSNGATTASISGLAPGTYTVTVTSGANTVSGTAIISEPAAIGVSVSGTNLACNGVPTGNATATATGGVGSFTYAWSNGGTTQTISNLAAGTYTVTTTDANGCTKTGSITLTQPTGMTITFTIVKPSCFGGSNGTAKANATGGVGTKTYAWSNGQSTQTATGLSAGAYIVTVTDAQGCTKTATATVTQPTAVTTTMTPTHPLCNGTSTGKAKVVAAGGTGSKTYLWNNGQTTQTAINLPAGIYTVTCTDTKGCTGTGTTTLIDPPQLVIVSITSVAQTGNWKVTMTASGGTGTKKYRRETTPGSGVFTAWQTGTIFNNVPTGTYIFQVQDAKLCLASQTQAIPVVLKPAGSEPTEIAENQAVERGESLGFDLLPNPAKQFVQLNFENEIAGNGQLEISDLSGKIIFQTNLETLAGDANRISLEDFPAGLLMVTVKVEGRAPVSKPLVVIR